jgi:hypothetical protein
VAASTRIRCVVGSRARAQTLVSRQLAALPDCTPIGWTTRQIAELLHCAAGRAVLTASAQRTRIGAYAHSS